MPPAISDDEGSASESEIPYKEPIKNEADAEEDEEEDGDEDENENEDEYVVEKIMGHMFEPDGTLLYEIKWMGYERKEDRTWEPEENLAGAKDVLQEYFESRGGRPVFKPKKRKLSQGATATPEPKGRGRGRKADKDASASASASAEPGSVKKSVKKEKGEKFNFPNGTWEHSIQSVDTIEEVPDHKTGTAKRWAMVVWNDGKKTRHELQVLNQKCPQKMLAYYEQHLYFNYS